MKIQRTSLFTGEVNVMDLPVTVDQLHEWQSGKLIQHVFPDLTPSQREFLMTGVTPDEWDEAMGEEA